MFTSTLALVLFAAARSVSAVACATPTFGSCEDGIIHSYDPDDGMICDPLDCGGGRAPPKSTVPCCPAYTGTEACVTTTSYLSCFAAASTSAPNPTETANSGVPALDTTTTTFDPFSDLTAAPSSGTSSGPAPTTGDNGSGSASTPTTTGAGPTSAGNIASRTSSAQTSSTSNAAFHIGGGSLMAIAGAAVGVVLL